MKATWKDLSFLPSDEALAELHRSGLGSCQKPLIQL